MESRSYETVVVLSPNLNAEEEEKSLGTIESLFEKHGANLDSINKWGRLELAHPTKKYTHGAYYCLTFSSDSSNTINNLSNELNILEYVIKYQSHRTGEKGKKVKLNPNAKPKKEE